MPLDISKIGSQVPIPSFHQLMRLYTISAIAGPSAACATGAALTLDNYFNPQRHYMALASFWLSTAYAANNSIAEADLTAEYKDSLGYFFYLLSFVLIFAGIDIFHNDVEMRETLESTAIIAEFVDQNGSVAGLKKSWNEGYVSCAKYTANNCHLLAENNLLKSLVKSQLLDLSKIFLLDCFLPFSPAGTLSLFLISQKYGMDFDHIALPILYTTIRKVIEMQMQSLSKKLKDQIKTDTKMVIAEKIFQSSDPQQVIRLSNEIKESPTIILPICDKIFNDISKIYNSIIMPQVLYGPSASEVYNLYPSLVLMHCAMKNIFNNANIAKTNAWILEKLGIPTIINNNQFTQTIEYSGNKIKVGIQPDSHYYTKIPEILKLSAGGVINDQLQEYFQNHSADSPEANPQSRFIGAIIECLRDMVNVFVYLGQLSILGVSQSEVCQIETQLSSMSDKLRFKKEAVQNDKPLDKLKFLLHKLQTQDTDKLASREINNEMKLMIESYSLFSIASNPDQQIALRNTLLHFEKLTFEARKIYALEGCNGAGKTTFLTDIAGFLDKGFESQGSISYPTKDGHHKLGTVFCGSEYIAMLGETLFTQITYRIPKEYIHSHKQELSDDIQNLCDALNSKDIYNKINDKDVKLSAGQSKIILMLGAVLYIKHCPGPVIAVFDETLTNLTPEVKKTLGELMKKAFTANDSIILCVDHEARHYPEIYDVRINVQELGSQLVEISSDIA